MAKHVFEMYTTEEGGQWGLLPARLRVISSSLLALRSTNRYTRTVPMMDLQVHSLLSKDKATRWDCINGFTSGAAYKEAQLGEQDNEPS